MYIGNAKLGADLGDDENSLNRHVGKQAGTQSGNG